MMPSLLVLDCHLISKALQCSYEQEIIRTLPILQDKETEALER